MTIIPTTRGNNGDACIGVEGTGLSGSIHKSTNIVTTEELSRPACWNLCIVPRLGWYSVGEYLEIAMQS
jgi:hypothetical protein